MCEGEGEDVSTLVMTGVPVGRWAGPGSMPCLSRFPLHSSDTHSDNHPQLALHDIA